MIYKAYYSDELYHYGVIGMKWGVRKAKEYHRDRTKYALKQNNKIAKKQYKEGKLSKEQYKAIKKQNKKNKYADDADYYEKMKNIPKKDKGKKVTDIFSNELNAAKREIPHYIAKKAAIKVGKLGLKAGSFLLPSIDLIPGAGGLTGMPGWSAAKSIADNASSAKYWFDTAKEAKRMGNIFANESLMSETLGKITDAATLKDTGTKLINSSRYAMEQGRAFTNAVIAETGTMLAIGSTPSAVSTISEHTIEKRRRNKAKS